MHLPKREPVNFHFWNHLNLTIGSSYSTTLMVHSMAKRLLESGTQLDHTRKLNLVVYRAIKYQLSKPSFNVISLRYNNTDVAEYDYLLSSYLQGCVYYESVTLCATLHLHPQ